MSDVTLTFAISSSAFLASVTNSIFTSSPEIHLLSVQLFESIRAAILAPAPDELE
jgi:hypothetical protein